ncbi:MAG TPA: hypothetical protein ENK85_05850 [Saprospiraceae bacterium]|nr:hypothetical protein [Saprospiraceae bacterium]
MLDLSKISTLLILAAFPAFIGLIISQTGKKKNLSLGLLLLSAFAVRFVMISLDPFLHDWDEKFHAIVAKNMMEHPFKPMLRVHAIIDYDYRAWCCNHIWLHKQPLFLWQMALSMKAFGVSILAMRLPSVIMGTVSVFFIYQIADKWFKDSKVAFLAGLLYCFLNYQLELTSGKNLTAQNDIAFAFYLLGSLWAFTRYLHSTKTLKWAIIIGIFVAGAVLNKWLTGILVYGAWGLYILLNSKKRKQTSSYFELALSAFISVALFLPWQIYTRIKFPLESKWEIEYNRKHIFEAVEGHGGDIFFHLDFVQSNFGNALIIFMLIGLLRSFISKKYDRIFSVSIFSAVLFFFGFFSMIVATKMSSFTLPVWSILAIYSALGLTFSWNLIINQLKLKPNIWTKSIFILVVSILVFFIFKPKSILDYRSADNEDRNKMIANTQIYKHLAPKYYKNRVVLNLRAFNDIDLMFYKNANAFNFWPGENVIDSLQSLGYKFSAFSDHQRQILPKFIKRNKDILIIPDTQK